MNPFRNLTLPSAEAPPIVYYILPQDDADDEAPIGPGDLEIEFEFDPDFDAEDE